MTERKAAKKATPKPATRTTATGDVDAESETDAVLAEIGALVKRAVGA
jgi:hypothetical protein